MLILALVVFAHSEYFEDDNGELLHFSKTEIDGTERRTGPIRHVHRRITPKRIVPKRITPRKVVPKRLHSNMITHQHFTIPDLRETPSPGKTRPRRY